MPGSLIGGFLLSRWRGKCSRHSRRMRNPQFYVYLIRGPWAPPAEWFGTRSHKRVEFHSHGEVWAAFCSCGEGWRGRAYMQPSQNHFTKMIKYKMAFHPHSSVSRASHQRNHHRGKGVLHSRSTQGCISFTDCCKGAFHFHNHTWSALTHNKTR